MISVVLLSWQRSPSVRRICTQLGCYGLVDDVIVWNNNPDEHLDLPGPKMRSINSSCDLGLFTRFAAASLARNPCILFHDDDLYASEGVLNQFYVQWSRRPEVCHTLFGRNSSISGQYSTDLAFGPVEIALTRYTMVHRKICVHALAHTPNFADLPGCQRATARTSSFPTRQWTRRVGPIRRTGCRLMSLARTQPRYTCASPGTSPTARRSSAAAGKCSPCARCCGNTQSIATACDLRAAGAAD